MLKKQTLIKDIAKIGNLKETEANKYYNVVMQAISEGLLKSDGIKIPDVGIIKVITKKERKIKVPNIEEKISVPKRKGLTIEESKFIKYYLNKKK